LGKVILTTKNNFVLRIYPPDISGAYALIFKSKLLAAALHRYKKIYLAKISRINILQKYDDL